VLVADEPRFIAEIEASESPECRALD
jgi:hypothetical protein